MGDPSSPVKRGALVIGAVLIWVAGLLWVLQRKGLVEVPGVSSPRSVDAAAGEGGAADFGDEEDVAEIVIQGQPEPEPARRSPRVKATPEPEEPEEDPGPPRYPVWFESERSIGVCKITYDGGSKTANLHVDARLPEGKLKFRYTCGRYSGQGSITVKPKRVNGVLFCKDAGGVTVQTVRSKDGRCARR